MIEKFDIHFLSQNHQFHLEKFSKFGSRLLEIQILKEYQVKCLLFTIRKRSFQYELLRL